MNSKICTSIEQSKKFIELGVDINTADMCWTNHLFNAFLSSWRVESTPPQEYKSLLDRFVVRGYLIEPAWSLPALYALLPERTDISKAYSNDCVTMVYWCWTVMSEDENECDTIIETSDYDNPVDACFEMIIKLHERNLL